MSKVMLDSHRRFLQSFMARGILNPRDVRKLHRTSCEYFKEAYSEDALVDFVNTINQNIKPVHLEIRKVISEDTGSHCYGIVNSRESDILKLASDYTPNELEFFKKVVEAVVEADSGTLSAIEALNIADKLDKRIPKKEAEALLRRLEADKWLTKSAGGTYSLSPRSILELEQYLLEQFSDWTKKCNMCGRIAVQGQCCAACEVKLHHHCATRFFDKKAARVCPGKGCGAPWTHEVSLAASGSKENDPNSTSPGDGARRKRKVTR